MLELGEEDRRILNIILNDSSSHVYLVKVIRLAQIEMELRRHPDGDVVAVYLSPSGRHRAMAAIWPPHGFTLSRSGNHRH
jgi:hypothetical protein